MGATPWWFPSKTAGGAMNADRLVLPIPEGVHWSEVQPMRIPGLQMQKALPAVKKTVMRKVMVQPPRKPPAPTTIASSGLWFAPEPVEVEEEVEVIEKPAQPAVKVTPTAVAFVRELRDRWLEQVNAEPELLLERPRYEVARAPPARVRRALEAAPPKLLAAA